MTAQVPGFNPNQPLSPLNTGVAHNVYNPSVTTYEPAVDQQQPNNNPNQKSNRNKLFMGLGSGVAALLATGALFLSSTNDEPKKGPETTQTSSEGIDTLPSNPSDMTAEQFKAVNRIDQLNFVGPLLNDDPQATAERMRSELIAMGRTNGFTGDDGLTTRELVAPSITNTPQQIWDQITVASFQAWETAQNGDMQMAQKLATGVSPVDSNEYSDLIKLFGNGGTAVIPDGAATDAQPIITSGEYHGVTSTGLGLIEFVKTSAYDPTDRVTVVAMLEKGTEPDSERWTLVKTIKINN